jgi:hypothetical protein
MRQLTVAVGFALVAAACGSDAPAAPPISAMAVVCAEDFCVTAPDGWDGLVEGNAISFTHPVSEDALVFVSVVDLVWLLESSGSSWPASLESVERAYWSLLGSQPLAPERVLVSPDGRVESRGRFDGLPRWHATLPIDGGPLAVTVTIQLPSEEWDGHARTFLDGVTLVP